MTPRTAPSPPPATANGTRPAAVAAPSLGPGWAGVPSRRRPAVLLLGVLLVGGGAVLAALLLLGAGDRTRVVAVVRDVPVGQTVTTADVAAVRVGVDPALQTVPAGDLATVVGQRAAVDLRAGTLLTGSQLTTAPVPGDGEALLGLDLAAGQLPAAGPGPGDPGARRPRPGQPAPPHPTPGLSHRWPRLLSGPARVRWWAEPWSTWCCPGRTR